MKIFCLGKSERIDSDKNRERRKKKMKQKIHAKAKQRKEDLIDRLNPGLGNKYSKEKAKKLLEKVVSDKNVDKVISILLKCLCYTLMLLKMK